MARAPFTALASLRSFDAARPIRPDQIVAWRGTTDAGAAQVLARVIGR
jgi:hypothetical protein